MDKYKKWIFRYKHFALMGIFGLLQLYFVYCEKTVVPKYIMYSPLDSQIPFIKEFVVPYVFWYIYMLATFVYLGIVSTDDYYKYFIMMSAGMAVACTVYLIFPNGQNLRPVITESDIFSRTINWLYSNDTNTNVAPSLHVYDSIAVHMALINCSRLRTNKLIRWGSFITMVAISASTVFIKQHSILDVMWGTILALVMYGAVYNLPKLLSSRTTPSRELETVSAEQLE